MDGHRKGRTKPSNLREQVDPETMKMYPTPTAQDHSRNTVPPSIGKTRGMDLSMRVVADEIERQKKMYPTPQAADHLANQSETLEAWEKRAKQKKEEKGINLQFALRHAVQKEEKQKRMYPTPRSSGQENAETLIKRKGEKAAARHNLTANVQMFPTPSASCQMDVVAPPETVKQNSSGWSVTRVGTGTKFGAKLNDVVNKVNQPIKPGGKLNSTFVEFLMGFPMDWTKVE